VVGTAGVVSAFLGSRIAIDMDPRTSGILFAILLVLVASRMTVTAIRERRRTPLTPHPRTRGSHGRVDGST
jgi:uncharacterized membrane protein YfcA